MAVPQIIHKLFPNLVKAYGKYRRKCEFSKQYGTSAPMYEWPLEKLVEEDMKFYEQCHGYRFDINKPVTFSEKTQWYKLFYHHPDWNIVSDKVKFKTYITEKLGEGHVVPMYGAWDNLDDIEHDWDSLPKTFILKANLSSDGNCIMIIKDKDSVNFKELRKELKEWLRPENTLMNSFVTHIYNSTPMILAEEFISDISHQVYDYKFFCYDGVPRYCYVQTARKNSKITFFDMDWNKLDARFGDHENCDVPKPKHFDEMLEIAKKLSVGFPFIRVDFFETESKLYMAELTFNNGGGLIPYTPKSFDEELGKYFNVPC